MRETWKPDLVEEAGSVGERPERLVGERGEVERGGRQREEAELLDEEDGEVDAGDRQRQSATVIDRVFTKYFRSLEIDISARTKRGNVETNDTRCISESSPPPRKSVRGVSRWKPMSFQYGETGVKGGTGCPRDSKYNPIVFPQSCRSNRDETPSGVLRSTGTLRSSTISLIRFRLSAIRIYLKRPSQ